MRLTRRLFNQILAAYAATFTVTVSTNHSQIESPASLPPPAKTYSTLHINDIIVKDEWWTRPPDRELILALIKSISEIGVMSHLIVAQVDGKNILVAGFARAVAIKSMQRRGKSSTGMDYEKIRSAVPCMFLKYNRTTMQFARANAS